MLVKMTNLKASFSLLATLLCVSVAHAQGHVRKHGEVACVYGFASPAWIRNTPNNLAWQTSVDLVL
jgi:hypothetical protein